MSVQLLSFKGQGLEAFPEEILQHKEITNLNLEDNKITTIPEWITSLANLKVLYLSNNCLSKIDVLTRMPSLEVLHLSHNNISEIPEGIGQLKKLRRLFLNNNLLSGIPDTLCDLGELSFLLLAHNRLLSIPDKVAKLEKLETLNVFDNRLTSIPGGIGGIRTLDYLQLSSNEITELPEDIGYNKSITTLEVFSNKLGKIPSSFKSMDNLKGLNLGDNHITRVEHLPASLLRLSIYSNPVNYIASYILERFSTPLKESWAYLYVDTEQSAFLALDKSQFGEQLKIINLNSGMIHWTDCKSMPIELQQKWGLKRTRD